ncbi:hypothetical protein TNCV_1179161 [Trichonephila clavipes]|nr:hypothetical protein TNCV_1179161 [Trichonephila clavipes]
MVSVQSLLDQCRHRTTIVFGNLGQWPDRVTYYEQEYPYNIFFELNSDCIRDADVYVKWLKWLDDWEMNRDDNVPLVPTFFPTSQL